MPALPATMSDCGCIPGALYLPGPKLSVAGIARVVVDLHYLLERLGAPVQENHRQALAVSR